MGQKCNPANCQVARGIYEQLFMYMIGHINRAVKVPEDEGELMWTGVLDIFGFEVMAVNSLEQFLINYANERLQQFFIENVRAPTNPQRCWRNKNDLVS